MKKKACINAENLNLWQCCGNYYAPGIKQCPKCGKMRGSSGLGEHTDSERECPQSPALELPTQLAPLLEGFAGRVLVRIERHSSRELDSDNFIAGCKELRDAIAEALGRSGDSEKDEIEFEYAQIKSKSHLKTVVLVKKINKIS